MNEQNILQPNESVQSSKHIWITIIAVIVTAIVIGGGVYAWQQSSLQSTEQSLQRQITDLQNQIKDLKKPTQPIVSTPETTRTPTQPADETANWETYTNPQNKFEFLYPSTYPLEKLENGLPLLNHKIYWYVSSSSYKDCRGECAVVDSVEKITIASRAATKIKGWVGPVGGNIPQSYIKYEIPMPSSDYLVFTLWELPQDGDLASYTHDREIQPISQKEEVIFDRILSTFQFTD